jgi:hypothetical protein
MNYDPQNENLLETKNYVNQKLVSNRTENPAEQSAVTQEFYASGNVKAEHFEKYGFEGRVTKYQDTTEHLKISNTEHNIPSEGYTTITTYDEMTGLPSSAVTRFDDTHRIAARTNFTPDGQKDTTTDYDREGRKTRFGSYDNNGILYLAINYKTVKDRQVPDTVDYYKDNGDWMTRLPADKPAPKDRNNIDPPPKPKPAPSPPY